DLVRLCRASGVRLVAEPATGIDVVNRRVTFAGRPALAYDVLSLGLGSLPARPSARDDDWPMRPLDSLLDRIDALPSGPFRLADAPERRPPGGVRHRRLRVVPGLPRPGEERRHGRAAGAGVVREHEALSPRKAADGVPATGPHPEPAQHRRRRRDPELRPAGVQ